MSPTDSIIDAYWQTPPMARTAATLTFVLSVGIHFELIPWHWFIYHPFFIWKFPPQIWRFVTTFMITDGGLGLLFDTYFLYRYMSELESGHPRFPRKEDVLWYMMFVGCVILGINYFVELPFSPVMPPLTALILAMCYSVTQDQRGVKATFYFITIPAQLTPFCMILINLLFPNGIYRMMLQLEGLVAAHLFDFLSRLWPEFGGGRNLISTPTFLSRVVQTPRVLQRNFGTVIRPTDQASGHSTGASRGPLPDSWQTRGRGQRLG